MQLPRTTATWSQYMSLATNVFGNLGRNLITEKLKGSLFAPVLMNSKIKNCNGPPCLYLDKRHCLSAKSTLPISITELCRKLCHRQHVTHLEFIKTGAVRLPFNFSVIKFLPKLPKTLKFGKHTLKL